MGPKGMRMGSEEDFRMRNFIAGIVYPIGWVIKCRRLRWAGQVVRMEERRNTFKILTDKLTGRPKPSREKNIRIDI